VRLRHPSLGRDLFRGFHQVFKLKCDLADDLKLGDEVVLAGVFAIVDLRAIEVDLEAALGDGDNDDEVRDDRAMVPRLAPTERAPGGSRTSLPDDVRLHRAILVVCYGQAFARPAQRMSLNGVGQWTRGCHSVEIQQGSSVGQRQ
jgi:hypothetical protein